MVVREKIPTVSYLKAVYRIIGSTIFKSYSQLDDIKIKITLKKKKRSLQRFQYLKGIIKFGRENRMHQNLKKETICFEQKAYH